MRSDSGLQAGEGEVERVALQQGTRQRIRVGIAELGEPGQRRSARIADAEQLGRLVERLAGGVVDRVAEERVAADVGDVEELRVATRDEQRDKGEGGRVGGEEGREEVAFEVVHPDGRPAERGGERAGDSGTDEQRSGQSGTSGVGDYIDVGSRQSRLLEASFEQRQDAADVIARGELRHDSTIRRVQIDLAVQLGGGEPGDAVACADDERHAGLVAGGFDAEHVHGYPPPDTSWGWRRDSKGCLFRRPIAAAIVASHAQANKCDPTDLMAPR